MFEERQFLLELYHVCAKYNMDLEVESGQDFYTLMDILDERLEQLAKVIKTPKLKLVK